MAKPSGKAFLATAIILGAAFIAGTASANGAGRMVALRDSTPAWASRHALHPSPADGHVSVRVILAPRGGVAALASAVLATTTPRSPSYRHFLTPAQFRARYEPTDAAVSAVRGWLQRSGMHVAKVSRFRRSIAASGNVASAEHAFGTTLAVYRRARHLVRAPRQDVRVPAGVSRYVWGEAGLDTTPVYEHAALTPPPRGEVDAGPCSRYYGRRRARFKANRRTRLPSFHGAFRSYHVCGYTPIQLRRAYHVGSTGLTGNGQTIGIVDAYADQTIAADANRYAHLHGDPGFASGQLTQHVFTPFGRRPGCAGPAGWSHEETLDVEAAHAMAPRAKVIYFGAKDCGIASLLHALTFAVDTNQVSVISCSWGGPESNYTSGRIAAVRQVILQGEAQGITFLWPTGDHGNEHSGGRVHVEYPASDPFATAVGGTSTAIGRSGRILWQTGWGSHAYLLSGNGRRWLPRGFYAGTGGGFSRRFARPLYMHGIVGRTFPPGRAVPDVAMDADSTTGMLVGQTEKVGGRIRFNQTRIGGTSLAAPLMAGMVAMAAQHAGGRIGDLTPIIYRLKREQAGAFTDVTTVHSKDGNVFRLFNNGLNPRGGSTYVLATFGHDTTLATRKGWDDATGVGSPDARFLTVLVKAK